MQSSRSIACLPLLACLSSCIVHIGNDREWDDDGSLRIQTLHRRYGSGISGSQTREIATFDRISVEGGNMDVHVKVGTPQSVYVKGDDDLLAHLETRVEEGTLVIDIDSSYEPVHDFDLQIGVAELRSVDLSGSASIDVEGISADSFDLSISGSGDVAAHGTTKLLAVQLSGSGNADLGSLSTNEAQVRLSGSGSVAVHASEKLAVILSGSGSVSYSGSPSVEQRISGSGSVSSR